MQLPMFTVQSVAFALLLLMFGAWLFLAGLPGRLLTGADVFCGLRFRFRGQGHLCLWCRGLCAVDRCEDYGRLEGTKSMCVN